MTDRVLPTGTVTFLFCDMEGSTRLVQDLGPAVFSRVLEQHNALLRDAFGRHDGVERGTQGDSFLVLFRDAPAAVAAAAEAQAALAATTWPSDAAVRVRMGIHTGMGTLGGDDYVGVDVHRAARIAALAHGGQVLLSDATRALVQDALPAGVAVRALGEHRIRDLARPERVHQLVVEGLPAGFPPLRTGARVEGTLPARLTSFVGRERELVSAAALLSEHRLVTLTGPGGTGKSRLAIELARSRADRFDDGVWFVALEAIHDPGLVPAEIATCLSLLETPGTSPLDRLRAFLADRCLLLVLDNFEQLVDAAPVVGELLESAPRLHALVTSRSPLRLSIEQEFPVAPLNVPGRDAGPEEALAADSVRLFVERARRVQPDFELSADEAPSVLDLCRRLDGLPLGIELAASRVGLFPPKTIAERLAGRLDLPGGGTRDRPARQQTLEATIGWSHDLLDDPARTLFARLAVFSGGSRLEEAEAVAGPVEELGAEVIDAISTLVDQSLVQAAPGPGGPRFRMLETIRMFAAQRLVERAERDLLRQRHAAAYLGLAEEAAQHMPARGQVRWLDVLSADHDNLRAAIDWACEAGEAETAHRLVSALWRYWQFRGHLAEGSETVARVLALPGSDAPTPWRMRAIEAAGGLEWWHGAVVQADARYTEQLELARTIGDSLGIADALFNLLHSRYSLPGFDQAEADAMRAEARERYARAGDERQLARLDWTAGYPLMATGRFDEAAAVIHAVQQEFERLDDEFYGALASSAMGGLLMAPESRDVAGALRWGIRSLRAHEALGDTASATLGIRAAAILLLVAGLRDEAATMYGCYEALSHRHGFRPPINPEDWLSLGYTTEQVADSLRAEDVQVAYRRGAAMSLPESIDFLEDIARAAPGGLAGSSHAPG